MKPTDRRLDSGLASNATDSIAPISRSALKSLDCYREPLFLIDIERRLHFVNVAGKRVFQTRSGLAERDGLLTLGSPKTDAQLRSQLVSARQSPGSRARESRGIRVGSPSSTRCWLILVHAMGTEAHDADGVHVLVQAIGRTRPRSASAQLLHDLFGLTAGECIVAAEVMRGRSAREAAERLELSHETVRTHLKNIYRKCNLGSQGELLSLLASISQFTFSSQT